MYNPKSIANFFIEMARSRGAAIDPMKLQKLVYYANGWYAGYTGTALLNEPIEAWPYGPVIPSLYHEFKQYGRNPIGGLATEFDGGTFDFVVVPPPQDESLRSFLTSIWNSYSGYSGVTLSEMTHAPGGPWDITMQKASGMRGVDIPQELILDHFRSAVRNANRI